ncbi:MAG: substrate-binding domain-containing protein, partial [Planctomycetota bacterium]
GIEPGKGVTVIACDNDPALAGLNPQIATIDVRPDRIGKQAVEQLMSRIEKPELYARANILIEPTLVDASTLAVG